MSSHDALSQRNEIIQSSRRLHCSLRGNDRDDHSQYARRRTAGWKREKENKDRQADAGNCAEGDTAKTCANENTGEEDDELERDSHFVLILAIARTWYSTTEAREGVCGEKDFLCGTLWVSVSLW